MLWLGFADNPPPEFDPPPSELPESEPSEPSSPPADPPTPPKSLFVDAEDDELLDASDLDAIDESMQRAGHGVPQATADLAAGLGENNDDEADEEDAVDPAVADASIAFIESHGEDGPPVVEDEPDGAMVWLVPWAISLLAHAGLVIVAIFVVWSVQQVLDDDEVIVPLVTLSDTPGTPLEVEVVQRLETQTPAMAAPPVPEPVPMELELELDLALPGIGEPMAAEAPSFELNLNDAAEFDTNFFGSGGNAKNIVFVLEADGSIISDYPQIVDELAKSLRDMSEKQRFGVIVFDGEDTKEVPPRGLKRATGDAKGQTIAWLRDTRNVQNMGSGDPVKALERAFRLEPDLIYLLSQNLYNPGRGRHEVQKETIVDSVAKRSRGIRVNTIEFNDLDRLAFAKDEDGKMKRDENGNWIKIRMTLMEEIAKLTGGEYLAVTTNVIPE
ncbi:MAG: hypothetical protein AAGJ38_09275 [Planctomycetota bacterium]